jgi:hypothetical protein
MNDIDLDELRSELNDFATPEKKGGRSAREERIIAGFEEIQRFVEKSGHAPRHGEGGDIFERLYAVRLDRLRTLDECRSLLTPLDHQGLLSGVPVASAAQPDTIDDDELLAELEGAAGSSDITKLRHVRTSSEKREAEEIASREKCLDFETFKPLFQQVQSDLDSGLRTTRRFVKDSGFLKADIQVGQFFILGGQTAYVAEVGEPIKAPNGETDARLRVIYSNGTESDLLLRSLQRALYKDEAGRRITEPSAGPLFGDQWQEDDIKSGTIYVLRSLSNHPFVAEHRELIHKIGVTGGKVENRIANAANDATYLLAEVEIIATYKLSDINRVKLEDIFHRIFARAQLDLTIPDRFGHPVRPREWFLVPLHVIDEAVHRIRDGSITNMEYDPKTARLVVGK